MLRYVAVNSVAHSDASVLQYDWKATVHLCANLSNAVKLVNGTFF